MKYPNKTCIMTTPANIPMGMGKFSKASFLDKQLEQSMVAEDERINFPLTDFPVPSGQL